MITIFKALEEFALDQAANDRAPATIKTYQYMLKPFAGLHGAKRIDEITHELMRDYVITVRTATKAKQNTRNTEYDRLNALFIFWRWCAARYDVKNPMLLIKRPRQPDPDVTAITPGDFARMYKCTNASLAGARDRALLCFLGSAGTRAEETISLKLGDLDLAKRRAIVRHGKGNRQRVVRFSRWTAVVLREWLHLRPDHNSDYVFSRQDGKPLTYQGLREILRRLARRAGVEKNWQPHKFRHFSIAESLLQGGEITQISKNAGHRDISTTVKYYTKFRDDGLDMMDETDALQSVFSVKRKEVI